MAFNPPPIKRSKKTFGQTKADKLMDEAPKTFKELRQLGEDIPIIRNIITVSKKDYSNIHFRKIFYILRAHGQ